MTADIKISGRDAVRHFIQHNLDQVLEADGHQVKITRMDAFSIEGSTANHFGASGGLKPEFIEASIAVVKKYFRLMAGTVASFDPAGDSNGDFLAAGIRCIRKIVSE